MTARPLPAPTSGTLRWLRCDDAQSGFATRAAFDCGGAPAIPLHGGDGDTGTLPVTGDRDGDGRATQVVVVAGR
ncbi:hypothetical protein AB0C76_30010 [Kitasatospora sp. NPDC048722]|uniref:hypothetical protein n=1 Tax=Kitasatospora sp. NPDC048722 TaxID=3155639 RepID=UPI0033F66203